MSSVSGVIGTSASKGIASSGSQGAKSGITASTQGFRRSPASACAFRVRDSRKRAQQRAKRQVGHGHPVLVAARDELCEADRHRLDLVDEPRFADAGLADELGDLALSQARRSDGRRELRQLALAADDRQLLRALLLGHAGDGADAVGGDRPFLPLDQEGLRLGLEAGLRAFEHLPRSEDLAPARPALRGVQRD